MRIQEVTVTTRPVKLKKPFKTALRTAVEIEHIEVEIRLDSGLTGIGSAAPTLVITGDSSESIQAVLTGPIRDALIGKELAGFQALLRAVQSCCVGNTSAKAAADMALHDAYSKWLGIPLCRFLGGERQLKTSMTVGVDIPEVMAADAAVHTANGFRSLKIKVGKDSELDLLRLTAVRDAIPKETRLFLDANQGWTPKEAVRLIHQLESERMNIEFIEQPVAAGDLEGLKFVTDRVRLPIMADESLFSPADALQLIHGRCADLLNIKLMKSGGLSNAWKIADIAEAAGMSCMVGSMMEPSHSAAAAAHFAAAHPNIRYVDLDAPLWLAEEPEFIRYEGEQLELSDDNGIGKV